MRVAKINPALLVWARESVNFTLAAAAKRLDVDLTRLSAWENGSEPISIPQLRKAASVYKRPLAVFYLPEPPKGFGSMRDFRRHPKASTAAPLSPEMMFEIRRANVRREVALDLAEELGETPRKFPVRVTLNATPVDLGRKLRRLLGVSVPTQQSWRENGRALREWRRAAETLGVLVFRAKLPPEEARGFSLAGETFPAIILNSADSAGARSFTLAHELAHLALRNGGVCDLHRDATSSDDVEVFCNQVAAEILVPADALRAEPELMGSQRVSEKTIIELAKRYSVSEEMMALRLIEIQRLPRKTYDDLRPRWAMLAAASRKKNAAAGGGEQPVDKALNENGLLYARLVMSSLGEERATVSEVSGYLGVRTQHLPNIAAEVRRRAVS